MSQWLKFSGWVTGKQWSQTYLKELQLPPQSSIWLHLSRLKANLSNTQFYLCTPSQTFNCPPFPSSLVLEEVGINIHSKYTNYKYYEHLMDSGKYVHVGILSEVASTITILTLRMFYKKILNNMGMSKCFRKLYYILSFECTTNTRANLGW